jgi:hypothetical protein
MDALSLYARQSSFQLVVAPSVVYEAFRTPGHDLRHRLVGTIASARWEKLMPEAYEEAEEFLAEVRRLRPRWLVPTPLLTARERNMRDWQDRPGSFWDRARREPSLVARHIADAEGAMLAQARAESAGRRIQAQNASLVFETARVSDLVGKPEFSLKGWDGDQVEAWRITGLAHASTYFHRPPFSEWIAPLVTIPRQLTGEASWVRFWLYEVAPEAMPRWWVRDACESQAACSTGPGSRWPGKSATPAAGS